MTPLPLVLIMSPAGVCRFLRFGLVGASGMAVNTGALLALHALGFDALTWPIWVSTELAILWNYTLNRRITWRDRAYGRWWLYNVAAIFSSLLAIQLTTFLVLWGQSPLWLASVSGIAVGMGCNYLVFDKVVFASLGWLSIRLDVTSPGAALFDDARQPCSASSRPTNVTPSALGSRAYRGREEPGTTPSPQAA